MKNRLYRLWERDGKLEEFWKLYYGLANSYKKSFQILIKNEIEESKKEKDYNDKNILPILANFYHFVELSLKSLLYKKI